MINQLVEDLIIFNEYFYMFLLFIISFLIAFSLAKLLGFKSIYSIIAFHAIILFVLVFIEILDYFFILIAIIEFVIMIKNSSAVPNSESN